MLEFKSVDWEEPNPKIPWNEMDELLQNTILSEAYEEQAYRSCPTHYWHLNIDEGNVSIYCSHCKSDYWWECQDDYQEYICFDVQITPSWQKDEWKHYEYGPQLSSVWLDCIL